MTKLPDITKAECLRRDGEWVRCGAREYCVSAEQKYRRWWHDWCRDTAEVEKRAEGQSERRARLERV